MGKRSITFFSDGLQLAGTIHVPPDFVEGQTRPAVLICHGRFAIKEWVPSRWTPSFLDAGYVCMTFDYRNLGESEGTPGRIMPLEEVRDVKNALTFLQCQPEVDAGQIGVLGWGLGGGVAIAAAAEDTRIKAVVCASGVANGSRYGRVGITEESWLDRQEQIRRDRVTRVLTGKAGSVPRGDILGFANETKDSNDQHQGWLDSLIAAVGLERASDPAKLGIPNEITIESMEALYDFAPDMQVHRISPRPVLIIHSEVDHEFPFSHMQDMFEQAGEPKRLIAVQGAGHLDWIDPTHPTQKIYVPQVVQWMKQQLPVTL